VRSEGEDSAVARWWKSRFGYRLLIEIAVMASLLTLYRLGRYLGRNQVDVAFQHARDVIQVEDAMGIANERGFQALVLDNLTFIRFMNRYYAMVHFPATVAFLAVVYVRTPDLYKRIRTIFIGVTGVGLVMQIAYPLAPPRMLSGFVDTVATYGPTIYEKPGVESFANQYAAMPSLHVGWALIVAWGALQLSSGRWRWWGVGHAIMTTLAVVVTANHYWADAIVALALVAVVVWLQAGRRWSTHREAIATSYP